MFGESAHKQSRMTQKFSSGLNIGGSVYKDGFRGSPKSIRNSEIYLLSQHASSVKVDEDESLVQELKKQLQYERDQR